uniref:Uncharacterized protein n=2 Tax=Kalanchoe fedtschenkoi TaxID=63787 RepID=A0A7N0TT68_KALFE
MAAPFPLPTPSSSSNYSCSTSNNATCDHRMLKLSLSFFRSDRVPSMCFANKRPWDSNAESFRNLNFRFSFPDDDDDDLEELEDDQSWIEQGSGFLDEAINNIFIFKVLKSYGWLLPFILISQLLVSGPKAFLLALGLAIGLSLIVYAFQNLFAETQSSPDRKLKRKKRSYTATRGSNVYTQPDKATRSSRKGSTVPLSSRNNNPVGKRVQGNTFGGWDELDEVVDYMEEPVKRHDRINIEVNKVVDSSAETVKTPDQTKVRSELNRMNRSLREMNRAPLLLRFLIAAFPFLSSWIKIPVFSVGNSGRVFAFIRQSSSWPLFLLEPFNSVHIK